MADLQAKCDLRSFIMTAPETVFHLIVGSESPVDLKHLNRVRDLPNVHSQVIAGIGHGDVARHCKECGLLAQFLCTDN